jgi:GT2 family glycosyltransferase
VTRILAIVVTHNSGDFVQSCVEGLVALGLTTVIVDNASTDQTLKQIPASPLVTVVRNPENRGFAGAVNQAVRDMPAEFYLLLNPDAVLQDSVEPLIRAIGENGHMAAAGLLVDMDGVPQKGFSFRRLPIPLVLAYEVLGVNRIWPDNAVNRQYRCLDADLLRAQVIEQPAGAFFLFPRRSWELLGGFDEMYYPVWFEDVDFCKRIHNRGATIWFDPAVRARHFGGHSVRKIAFHQRQQCWYGSLLRYAALHFSPMARRWVAISVGVAVVPRALFAECGWLRAAAFQSIKSVWCSVWRCLWARSTAK